MKKKSQKAQNLVSETTLAIESCLSEETYKPLTKEDLFDKLHLPEGFNNFFENALDILEQQKKIKIENHKIYRSLPEEKTITGILRGHPRGFAFVSSSLFGGVFIPPSDLLGALDGDRVKVEINYPISAKGPDGKVIAIEERTRKTCTAIVNNVDKNNHYWIYIPILGKQEPEKEIASNEKLLKGDRILVSIHQKKNMPHFQFEKKLSSINDSSKDIEMALLEYGIPEAFPSPVLDEIHKFKDHVTEQDKKDRVNLCNLVTITIDPERAKDFDDAISLTKDQNGYHLGVHIADAAHYVKPHTALDKEAYQRANSTYFPGFVAPMLPHELSSHLCSLLPDVERLTVSVFMNFDYEGSLIDYNIERSFIRSHKRLSYDEAFHLMQHEHQNRLYPLLHLMKDLALLLKKKRQDRGSFDFTLSEPEIVVDENGSPTHIQVHEYDITHQMIEEFMLKANETIAKHLYEKKSHVLYRIHEAPSKDNMETFFTLARAIGFPLPGHPTNSDIQKLFDKAKKSPFKDRLSMQFIRSMKLAHYSADNIGHYGLALEHYCHFTSPIRRYSDLIAQRLLFQEAKNIDIVEIANHVSEKERISTKAESSITMLKKLRYLMKMQNENPDHVYKAIITQIKPFGFAFEVKDFYIEGFLHLSEFWDFFRYDERNLRLIGSKSKKIYALGQEISLHLKHVDLIHQDTIWALK